MPIPIPDADAATVPAVPEFVPDRLGVRSLRIDVDRATDVYAASFTPCPANASVWGPDDAAEVATPNLIAELVAAPDSQDKADAIAAVLRMRDDVQTIAGFLLTLRG